MPVSIDLHQMAFGPPIFSWDQIWFEMHPTSSTLSNACAV